MMQASNPMPNEMPHERFRILVADDEQSILDAYEHALDDSAKTGGDNALADLENELFSVREAEPFLPRLDLTLCHQGDEVLSAVEHANKTGDPYSVAFLDVRMPPGANGVEVAKEVRLVDPNINIVFVTGYSDLHPDEISQRIPPRDKVLYCQKPLHKAELKQFALALSAKWAAERDLRDSTEQLGYILNNSPTVIRCFEARDDFAGKYISEGCNEHLGFDPKDFGEDPAFWIKRIHPEDRDPVTAKLRELSAHEHADLEYRIQVGNGEYRWLSERVQLVRDRGGAPSEIIGCCLDISDRKAVDSLRREKAAAEAANRAKSVFLANMSHEVRTPMNGVMGFADLLTQTELSERQRYYVDGICASAKTMLGVIDDILDISRIEAGKLKLNVRSVDLRACVGGIMPLFGEPARQKGLDLRLDLSPQLPNWLRCDPVRISQVLNNLVSNAVKFTERGEVNIRVSSAEDSQGTIPLRLEVSDTGIGISPEDRARIFGRFEQADMSSTRKAGGAGLGLAITRHLIELMGGTLDVQSTLGKGSSFVATIPLEIAESPHSPAEARSPSAVIESRAESQPHFRPGARILLVEDDAVNQAVGKAHLESLGFVVEVAEDGKAAVAAFAKGEFDLIFMDYSMPEMDGVEAAQRIREIEGQEQRPRRTPIIALTAMAMDSDRNTCMAAGMDDHLSKPFEQEDLREALSRWLPDFTEQQGNASKAMSAK